MNNLEQRQHLDALVEQILERYTSKQIDSIWERTDERSGLSDGSYVGTLDWVHVENVLRYCEQLRTGNPDNIIRELPKVGPKLVLYTLIANMLVMPLEDAPLHMGDHLLGGIAAWRLENSL